jgi:hypothetical protein
MSSPSSAASSSPAATTTDPAPTGRLAVLTAFALAASAVPLPVLPDLVVVRVRGATAHDTVARHGLSLTNEARAIFASADAGSNKVLARKAGEALVREVLKRLGPLGALTTLTRGLEVYALGILLDRYIQRVRASGSVRIDIKEAKRVRDAIDKAVLRSLSPALAPSSTTLRRGAEDLRGEVTRWTDALLLTGASLPGYIERRLHAAFDEIASESSGLRDG